MEKFLARQPIFNSERLVYGYELLFRSGPENYFPPESVATACASTVDDLFLIGIEKLTRGRRTFVNCDREFLLSESPALLPQHQVVFEILENILLDGRVVEACRELKRAGYLIALDDFVESPAWRPLTALADFIKIDVLANTREELRRTAQLFAHSHVRLIAEKVESYEMFRETKEMGYAYFQGYFFQRPEILSHQDVPADKLHCLRILQAVNREEINLDEVAQGIKAQAALSYRLLRYLNSPAFFLVGEVRSIPQSLRMLGERGIRKWVSVIAMACMAEGKPEELVMLPMIRARFCELLAEPAGMDGSADDLFLLGLLSVLDAVLDMKMQDILNEVTVRPEIRHALLGKMNPFREILDLALFYEAGAWEELEATAHRMGVDADKLPEIFMQALEWGRELAGGQAVEAT